MSKRVPFEENAYYHIYNRGLEKQTLFFNDRDFERFLWYIEKNLEKYKEYLSLVAYALLPNHFHFVLHNKFEGFQLSSFVGIICMSYTKYLSAKYQAGKKGQVFFEERFKSKKIDTEQYLRDCVYYVEHNPLKHELVDDLKQRPFTSRDTESDEPFKKEILTLDWGF